MEKVTKHLILGIYATLLAIIYIPLKIIEVILIIITAPFMAINSCLQKRVKQLISWTIKK